MNEQTKLSLTACKLCPRMCGVNRVAGELGYCKAGAKIKVARAALHFWEEPCISGTAGSGTVFFSHCTLGCIFCQNHEISADGFGITLTEEQLADVFLKLQQQGAKNINLVTPTHFVVQIMEAIILARKKGLYLPIVYNSSGYERVETLTLLDGLVDIYLPDFKYCEHHLAKDYSFAANYPDFVIPAIHEMVRQVGLPKFNKDGSLRKGVMIRHLMLPNELQNTHHVLQAVSNEWKDTTLFSLMNQYTPTTNVADHENLSKPITNKAYQTALQWMCELGITEGYIQEGGAVSESFIPSFALEGLEEYHTND